MKNSCLFVGVALLTLSCLSSMAYADTVVVNITGRVLASPCTLDTANSDQNVNLGAVPSTDLATPGQVSTAVPFHLVVKSCPAATTNAILTFGGTEDADAPGRYLNTGTATNVAVEVFQASTLQGPGTTITLPIQADRTATFNLQSRVYAKGQSTSGTIIATLQATFVYQ
ncbi:type 1 fimbrial protein [Scandinavium sp. TWS1a]|uniref:fimbrial protein n=1 Tax=Scandinavium tedordense TaxID=2926521 RepID=UPI001359F696|nr:fimbrial protein [Scandinavium tedordense]MCS2171960.1 type 1 fimbrial protein [Scandinavium tedordense]